MQDILDKIENTNDIKKINPMEYRELARDIRRFLVQNVSKTGGHLASNLGVVELTMALHLSMDFPKDKLIWDVGHQSYVHKMLTGRKDGFSTLRKYKGMSGFPKKSENKSDAFDTGHSSTAISAAIGMVESRDLKGENNKVVAVLGDGSLTGGMAYEALNNAGGLKSNLIIVLNDNNMSISENVGGMANYLGMLRTNNKYTNFKTNLEHTITTTIPGHGAEIINKLKKSKNSLKHLIIQDMLFENMGITYIGIIDGHNIESLMKAFKIAEKTKKAVVIHVMTKKGKGYKPAEEKPRAFHGIEPFNITTGIPLKTKKKTSYTKVFSDALIELGKKDKRLVAITAAMPAGTGLSEFGELFPKRFFDVGIAEAHAVCFAAGMASEGLKPVVAIYSTFLQRAYDQIVHDVCINSLPVIFAIDRAGIVGRDGETHQGIFDLSYLSHIPNLAVLAPKNADELRSMMEFALDFNGPIAIRYPRGDAYDGLEDKNEPIIYGKSETIYKGKDIAIIAVGSMVKTAVEVVDSLKEYGIDASLINCRFIAPIDEDIIEEIGKEYKYLFTIEENIKRGGYGEAISGIICEKRLRDLTHINLSIPDSYVEQGSSEELLEQLKLDADSILSRIIDEISQGV